MSHATCEHAQLKKSQQPNTTGRTHQNLSLINVHRPSCTQTPAAQQPQLNDIMLGLPEVVQSQILSSFCDGKSISTFFHVILCNQSLNPVAFDLVRDALVDRYKNLASSEQFQLGNHEEIRDVLDIVREEIRTCKVVKSAIGGGRRMVIDDGDASFREGVAAKISDYCAIIDYFDKMRLQKSETFGEFILWCGELQLQQGGKIRRACLSSKSWTVTAMDFFHDQLELNNHCLTHPAAASCDFLPSLMESPFGILDMELETDEAAFQRTRHSLSGDPDSSRYFLVPSQMEYEPTIGFAMNPNPNFTHRRCLTCHWDECDEGDFEYSLSRLSENAIRILSRLEFEIGR